MRFFIRRSLLSQLLSVYLLFVAVVLIGGVVVNAVVEQQLTNNVQAADQALAQEIATQTSLQVTGAVSSVQQLAQLVRNVHSTAEVKSIFQSFQSGRSDVKQVYWLDPFGSINVVCTANAPSVSNCKSGNEIVAEFQPPHVVEQSRNNRGIPVYEVGITEGTPQETLQGLRQTYTAGVIIADSVCDTDVCHKTSNLVGIVAVNLSLEHLSDPLIAVVKAQKQQGREIDISIIDDHGELVATPYSNRILYNVLNELPGAAQALQGQVNSSVGAGTDGQDWLFSSVPVPSIGWAVVVQRPVDEALAVVGQFHQWLLGAALLFALGGLLFWLILLFRVINPLHALAARHQSLPDPKQSDHVQATIQVQRRDEVGDLARSLARLEQDGLQKLGELHTLLETSNEVVQSLDPHAVVQKIIQEARRLVDVQAAAVLLPDDGGILHVLVSDGHSKKYDRGLVLSLENPSSAAVLALRDSKPVQKLLSPGQSSFSYDDGFRSVLAIPIISRHAGGVVLLVHRTEPHLFDQNEIDLLLTFANYATLAWEHAVLYERSDERLREVARENEQLYQQASEEKQKLEAIMGSMSDGLVLTDLDGLVLYVNQGTSIITGVSSTLLERRHISSLYDALCRDAFNPEECRQLLGRISTGSLVETTIDIRRNERTRSIHLRVFDVEDEAGQAIGRGLLLRDVTRERELDEFKSTLLAAVGHELRTPLAAIKGHASTLLQNDVNWSLNDQRHFLQTISSEADRLAQLVSNLLDLSRQEAGLLLLNRGPVKLQDLVNKVIKRLERPGVVLMSSIPADLPPVNVDSARIEVVLHNLVANGLAYGDGEVHVTAGKQDDLVIVSVSNNGPGIASDELPHIFERFYRAREGRQQHSGGTGLGLTICRAFVEAHGTTIWAESEGYRTTISFSLPCISPDADSARGDVEPMQLSKEVRS